MLTLFSLSPIPGPAQGPQMPDPYLHRCLCCLHRPFPWMCRSQLLSSPAGRRSATHSGPGYICHFHCTSQDSPLQDKAESQGLVPKSNCHLCTHALAPACGTLSHLPVSTAGGQIPRRIFTLQRRQQGLGRLTEGMVRSSRDRSGTHSIATSPFSQMIRIRSCRQWIKPARA